MRHQKAGRKLNRTGSHRNAMFRNMVTSLFEHGRIQTTDAKAKELRQWADRMITLARRGDLHARRQALAVMRDKMLVHKLFEEAPDRFGDRAGGYTHVIKVRRRRGDAAPISLVELVGAKEKKEQKKKRFRGAKKAVEKPKKEAPVKAKEKEEAKEAKIAEKTAEQEMSEMKQQAPLEPEGEQGSEEGESRSE